MMIQAEQDTQPKADQCVVYVQITGGATQLTITKRIVGSPTTNENTTPGQ